MKRKLSWREMRCLAKHELVFQLQKYLVTAISYVLVALRNDDPVGIGRSRLDKRIIRIEKDNQPFAIGYNHAQRHRARGISY